MKISIYCIMCNKQYEQDVLLSEDFTTIDGDYIETERGLCPKHAKLKQWIDTQCDGCAGGFGDCNLWKSFAFPSGYTSKISESDFESIESGVCPRYTTGSINFINGKIFEDEFSHDVAPVDVGKFFADEIREYIKHN